jgi:hypothetical protein
MPKLLEKVIVQISYVVPFCNVLGASDQKINYIFQDFVTKTSTAGRRTPCVRHVHHIKQCYSNLGWIRERRIPASRPDQPSKWMGDGSGPADNRAMPAVIDRDGFDQAEFRTERRIEMTTGQDVVVRFSLQFGTVAGIAKAVDPSGYCGMPYGWWFDSFRF